MPKILSKFVFNKLVFDYLTGKIDPLKLKKFEDKMHAEKDCLDKVEAVRASMKSVNDLSKINLNDSLFDEILNINKDFSYYISHHKEVMNYKYFKMATVSSLFGVLFVSLFALSTYFKSDVNRYYSYIVSSSKPEKEKRLLTLTNDDPIIDQIYQNELNKMASLVPSLNNYIEVDELIEGGSRKIAEIEVNDGKVNRVKTLVKKTEKKEKVNKKGPQGVLYRVYMSLSDLENKSEELKQLIVSLDGEKAGQSPLGYKKRKGRYFHLKLPEANRKNLLSSLGDLGRVRVDKERHWRQMPDGTTRIIIWVEDLDIKAKRFKRR